ncbi:MAG: hypothetical protein R3D35_02020 [Nitratireductor sp.]
MKLPKPKHKTMLLHAIARDIEAATAIAHTAAKASAHHAETGRHDEALRHILEAEPALFDAQKLTTLATYLNRIGRYQEEGVG